jgi:hypothetical protein
MYACRGEPKFVNGLLVAIQRPKSYHVNCTEFVSLQQIGRSGFLRSSLAIHDAAEVWSVSCRHAIPGRMRATFRVSELPIRSAMLLISVHFF